MIGLIEVDVLVECDRMGLFWVEGWVMDGDVFYVVFGIVMVICVGFCCVFGCFVL